MSKQTQVLFQGNLIATYELGGFNGRPKLYSIYLAIHTPLPGHSIGETEEIITALAEQTLEDCGAICYQGFLNLNGKNADPNPIKKEITKP